MRQTSMFTVVFVRLIIRKGLLVSGSTRWLIFSINIQSLVPLPKRSPLLERIKDMNRNEKQTSCWSHFMIIFGQLLPRKLHGKELVFLSLSLHLGQSSHHTIHVIKHWIVDSDDVVQSNGMPVRHPHGPVPEWP
jgi:hypothetical protein